MEPLCAPALGSRFNSARPEERNARPSLLGAGRRHLRALRRIRHRLEAHLMLANVIWGVGALIIGGYMIVALLRPEKF
jgi:hypothetical protein